MATKKEKEAKQAKLDEEKYRRSSQIAIIKASNQMIEEAKELVEEKLGGDERQLYKMRKLLDEAQDENLSTGKNYLQATPEEIENSVYTEANDYYKNKYQKHLEDRGVTDEELRNKSYGTPVGSKAQVVMSADSKKKEDKKWYSFMKTKSEKTKDGEEIISEINQSKRTIKGEGYYDDGDDIKDGGDIMKDIIKNNETVSEKPSVKEKEEQNSSINQKIEERIDLGLVGETKEYPDFDPSAVNPMTRYDIIELPSHGECYAHKKGRIPVRELTASDENLIASPNMYTNGQLIDTILKRCILDKNFSVEDMCTGDRDAVVLWLRSTAYGPEYTMSARHPETGKEYTSTINLGEFRYKDFNLKGDENGHFTYSFKNGDIAKFKILSNKEIDELQRETALKYINQEKFIVYEKITAIEMQVKEIFKRDTADNTLNDAIDYIKEWANKDSVKEYGDTLYTNFVTNSLIRRTVSINGNDDPEYVSEYINNLRLSESQAYRKYLFENVPGFDFSVEIQIPESDGGGSFESTFQYGNYIFIA